MFCRLFGKARVARTKTSHHYFSKPNEELTTPSQKIAPEAFTFVKEVETPSPNSKPKETSAGKYPSYFGEKRKEYMDALEAHNWKTRDGIRPGK